MSSLCLDEQRGWGPGPWSVAGPALRARGESPAPGGKTPEPRREVPRWASQVRRSLLQEEVEEGG